MGKNIATDTDTAKATSFILSFLIGILYESRILKSFYWTLIKKNLPLSPAMLTDRNWMDAFPFWYRRNNKSEMLWTEVKKMKLNNLSLA